MKREFNFDDFFSCRYPGLKTPMVGGIDLVGRVLETKSIIPAQASIGTGT
jgi:hypothetical protein